MAATRAIVAAGLASGVLDISAAFIQWGLKGVSPVRILQSIASGLLGGDSFQGGLATAALGGVLHFFIALCAAAAFYLAGMRLPFLLQRPGLWGPIYGVAVWALMAFIVVPLSRVAPSQMTPEAAAIAIAIHVFCVGLPIALILRRFKRA